MQATDWTHGYAAVATALFGGQTCIEILPCSQGVAAPRADAVAIALDEHGFLPEIDLDAFDIAITTAQRAPRPWVSVPAVELPRLIEKIRAQAAFAPVACMTARSVLRMSVALDFDCALDAESHAYSMLLSSEAFGRWRVANPFKHRQGQARRVSVTNAADTWEIVLERVSARNAFDKDMRDALVDALQGLACDPDRARIVLRGAGPTFSAGGDLAEFGDAADLGWAHLIRVRQSPARLIHAMRARVEARIHGDCIGAGIEIPAAAGRVVAASSMRARLPEISMGLIPGAGGCATLPRRIGRHRALYLALTGEPCGAELALDWGLVDAIEEDGFDS